MSFRRTSCTCLLLGLAALSEQGTLRAQTDANSDIADPSSPQGRKAEGRARYERGAQAYADGRFKDAIDLFLQADTLAPSAPLSFNIARAYAKIGDGAAALQWYRDYLRRSPEAANAQEVRATIAELEQELAKKGVMQLTVMSSPAGATVFVDEQPVGVTPFTGQFPPGAHRVVLSLRGYADAEHQLQLPADHAQQLEVPLLPDTRPRAVAAPSGTGKRDPLAASPGADESAKGAPSSKFGIVPWIVIGAGAGALGGAAAFELLRRGSEDEARDAAQVDYQAELDEMKSRQTTARVLGVVGGALLVGGGVLLAIDLSSKPKQPQDIARLGLSCGYVTCGVRVRGQF